MIEDRSKNTKGALPRVFVPFVLSGFRVSECGDAEEKVQQMDDQEALEYEYEEITDAGIVLRDRRAGYSTHGYDFDDSTGAIIGCALEVHWTLGPGFREIVYQRALVLELQVAGLEFDREVKVPIFYKGHQIDTRRADFVVEDVMVEIKAKSQVSPEDYVQALNYVKASGFKLGLLLNFGSSRLQIKRLVN
jgi:GxxExxY protein